MKTIIAAFADRATADNALAVLERERDATTITAESRPGDLVGDLQSKGVPADTAELYAEAVRRGAALVSVSASDDDAYRVADELDRMGSLDLETARTRWREAGWTGYEPSAPAFGEPESARERELLVHEGVPVIEEQVTVGKREVPRESVRVRTFIVERPVHETVELREERIDVKREPANEPVEAGTLDTTLSEGEVEITATGEEAVVGKQARVVERVRVEKDATTRTETIDETERRREVEVESSPALGTPTHRP